MSPSHHLNRTRRCLKFAAGDTAIGDYDRADKALSRAASHSTPARLPGGSAIDPALLPAP